MRNCIILFLITGIVWAQTSLDKLVYKDGRIFISDGNLKLTTEEKAIYNKKDRINNFFTILITTSVIVVAGFTIFNPFEGLGQLPGPIFTPPDA